MAYDIIVAGTGHRPPKIGGFSEHAFDRLVAVAIGALIELKPAQVISGMALGWDQALAQAAYTLGIDYWAAVPHTGQELAWPEQAQGRYRNLLAGAKGRTVVCPGGYFAWKMQARNAWMVERANVLLALWDGTTGGTYNCIQYARKNGFVDHTLDCVVARLNSNQPFEGVANRALVNVYDKWRR